MKMSVKIFIMLMVVQCMFTQITFGDVVVQKDAIGPAGGVLTLGVLLLIAAGIAIIWAISMMVIRSVRNKNVGK